MLSGKSSKQPCSLKASTTVLLTLVLNTKSSIDRNSALISLSYNIFLRHFHLLHLMTFRGGSIPSSAIKNLSLSDLYKSILQNLYPLAYISCATSRTVSRFFSLAVISLPIFSSSFIFRTNCFFAF